MRLDPLYARYPFFEAARAAVRAADLSPPTLVREGDPAVDRARERVERALLSGTVAPETPERWTDRDELLSYPVARILVSLVGTRAAVEKYAVAEAATAADRLAADLDADATLRSVETPRADLDTFLAEFDLRDAVRRVDGGGRSSQGEPNRPARRERDQGQPRDQDRDPAYLIAVGAYLRLSDPDWGADWRLVNRALADGEVPVDRTDLRRLLREAVRRRVAEGLPFDVRGSDTGDALADALAEEVAAVRDLLSDRDPLPQVGTVAPGAFPPCVCALLDRAGEDALPPHSAFAVTAFLVWLGLDGEAIAERWPNLADEATVNRATVLVDDGTSQYPPPSCATMQAFGDCIDPDTRCETIDNPVEYYAAALEED
jgi:DNA primase large subunit